METLTPVLLGWYNGYKPCIMVTGLVATLYHPMATYPVSLGR